VGQHDDIELILQDCLEKIQSGQETLDGALEKYPHLADELRPALEAALWFRMRKATLDARPGFVNASRRRVLEKIEQEQAIHESPRTAVGLGGLLQFWQMLLGQRRLVFQIALVLLLVFGMVAGTSGVARAAQNALPGDLLYPVKTSLERASIVVAVGDAAKANLHIRFAQRRLAELHALLLENHDGAVAATVSSFEEHINSAIRHLIALQAQDPTKARALAVTLQDVMQEQTGTLRVLAAGASEPTREQIERILLISSGVISLVDQTIPSPDETEVAIETSTSEPTSTQEIAIATQTAAPAILFSPSQTPSPTILLTPFVQLTTAAPGSSITATLSPTVTPTWIISSDDDDEDKKPTKTPKPTKTEKVKKPLPEPIRRPPKDK
jgi:Domain of unknown function (DUF5667)